MRRDSAAGPVASCCWYVRLGPGVGVSAGLSSGLERVSVAEDPTPRWRPGGRCQQRTRAGGLGPLEEE